MSGWSLATRAWTSSLAFFNASGIHRNQILWNGPKTYRPWSSGYNETGKTRRSWTWRLSLWLAPDPISWKLRHSYRQSRHTTVHLFQRKSSIFWFIPASTTMIGSILLEYRTSGDSAWARWSFGACWKWCGSNPGCLQRNSDRESHYDPQITQIKCLTQRRKDAKGKNQYSTTMWNTDEFRTSA